MTGRVDGKRILITGAGSGMGRSVARRLAAEGAKLTIFDLNAEAAAEARDEIVSDGGAAIAASGNVVNREDVAAAVAAGVDAYGALRGWWGIEFVSLKTRGPVALLG